MLPIRVFQNRQYHFFEKHKINLNQFPAFDDYIRCVHLADSIQIHRLFKDLEKAETEILKSFQPRPQEEAIFNVDRWVQLSKKLIRFSLTCFTCGPYPFVTVTLHLDCPLNRGRPSIMSAL